MSLEEKNPSEKSNEIFGKVLDNKDKNIEVKEIPIEDDAVKELCSKMYSTTRGMHKGFCMIKPYDQVFFNGYLQNFHQRVQDFEIFDDDVWICSFPRSGKFAYILLCFFAVVLFLFFGIIRFDNKKILKESTEIFLHF